MQEDAERPAVRLAFERPVERSLVHRRAVTEVYVTDSRPVTRTLFAVAAQLPRSHRYFTDHTECFPEPYQRSTEPAGAGGATDRSDGGLSTGRSGQNHGTGHCDSGRVTGPADCGTTTSGTAHHQGVSRARKGQVTPRVADGVVTRCAVPLDRTDAGVDPLLLTECCRQAATTVAHRYLGVPRDTAFLVTRWAARFWRSEGLVAAGGPGELTLMISATDLKERTGRLESVTLDVDLSLGGAPVGRATVGAAYLPTERYAALRALRRTTPPPLTSAMPFRGEGTPVAPATVGRSLPENVVLADAAPTPGGAVALLDVPARHPGIYDHPLDHVPAMGLIEAARQAALYAACRGAGMPLPRVAGFDAAFARFAELDAPTTVTARFQEPLAGTERAVAVEFHQQGAEICAITVTLADGPDERPEAPGAHRAPGASE